MKYRKVIGMAGALVLALTPWQGVLADTEVTGVDYRMSSNGNVIITLATLGDTPAVSAFDTDNPARIVLDMADTGSGVDAAPITIGMGSVQSLTTLAAGNRTRVLVDLDRPAAYEFSAESGQVVLTVAAAAPSTASYSGDFAVENVDFRRGEDGQGRMIITLDREGANVAVSASTGSLQVDIFNASLPEHLSQQFDVVDFATPVQMIDAGRRGEMAQFKLSVAGLFEHLAYQSGRDLIVEVLAFQPSVADDSYQVQFYEDKEYSGARVTFNFQDIPVRSVLQLIADVADLNIVVADNVAGNLTLRLTNVPWDQALDIVLDSRNLDKRQNGNVIWIAPTGDIATREQELLQAMQDRRELEPLQTALISVSYASASSLKSLIEESSATDVGDTGLLSDRGSVTIDERTNTLLVTDTADRIAEIQQLVLELDRPVRQVQIESRIVVASSDFSHELGVRFGVTTAHIGSNILAVTGDGEGPTCSTRPPTQEMMGCSTSPAFRSVITSIWRPLPVARAASACPS